MSEKIKNSTFWLISLTLVCGLVAGVAGAIITQSFLLKDSSLSYFNQELNLNSLNNNLSNLIIRDPKKVVVNQDLKVSETINSVSNSMVGIFKEINLKTKVDPLKQSYYSLENPLFSGLIIASDGWVVASVPLEFKDNFSVKDYVVVAADRKIYKIDKITSFKKLPGDILFFHLVDATNLPVRRIVPRSEFSLGQSLIVVDSLRNVWPTTLSSFKKIPEVLNSDSLSARIDLAKDSDGIQKNSFVFNLAGDLMAIISVDKEIIPAFIYNASWTSFWKKGVATRPFFGVNYLDLSLTYFPALNLNKGALIYPGSDKIAVFKDSPAFVAGLTEGDVITWVNNQEINNANDLADLIANYAPGDKLAITYLRAGQEKEVDIKLEEFK
jgi:S1-C subfamily serine protease